MDAIEKTIRIYRLPNGRVPFLEWLTGLRDERAKQRIQARIGRVRLGNFGQCASVGDGVHELKIDHGPGYRVYFGQENEALVILLCGGDKRKQDEDISEAKEYWERYKKERTHVDD